MPLSLYHVGIIAHNKTSPDGGDGGLSREHVNACRKGGQGLVGLSQILGFLQPAHPTIYYLLSKITIDTKLTCSHCRFHRDRLGERY